MNSENLEGSETAPNRPMEQGSTSEPSFQGSITPISAEIVANSVGNSISPNTTATSRLTRARKRKLSEVRQNEVQISSAGIIEDTDPVLPTLVTPVTAPIVPIVPTAAVEVTDPVLPNLVDPTTNSNSDESADEDPDDVEAQIAATLASVNIVSANQSKSVMCIVCSALHGTEKILSSVEGFIAHVNIKHCGEGENPAICFEVPAFERREIYRCCCNKLFQGQMGLRNHCSRSKTGCSAAHTIQNGPLYRGPQFRSEADIPIGMNTTSTIRFSQSPDPLPQSVEELEDLIAYFCEPVGAIKDSWCQSFMVLCLKLINIINTKKCTRACAAFLLLPGLFQANLRFRKFTPNDFLRQIMAEKDSVECIIRQGVTVRKTSEEEKRLFGEIRSADRRHRRDATSVAPVAKKIETLVLQGRPAMACKQLPKIMEILSPTLSADSRPDAAPLLTAEQKTEILRNLHPHATERDVLEDPNNPALVARQAKAKDTPALKLSSKSISKALRKLPTGSARGYSGWTPALIKQVFYQNNKRRRTSFALIDGFLASMLNGELESRLWTTSRTCLIPKPNSTSYRPLGIGEPWIRLLGKAVMIQIGDEIGIKLHPFQNGSGVPGGCEITARIIQLIYDAKTALGEPQYVAISCDVHNAFNELAKLLSFDGILQYVPGLAKWYLWAYGKSSYLRWSDGSLAEGVQNHTGSRQGDPLAGLVFCLGFQQVLLRLQEKLKACDSYISPRDNQQKALPMKTGLIAFMDDVTVFVHRRTASKALELIEETFQEFRIRLNRAKTCIVGQDVDSIHPTKTAAITAKGYRISKEGGVFLGVPVGTLAYRREYLRKSLEEMTEPFPALDHLHPTASFQLLRLCLNTRASYLFRVLGDTPALKDLFLPFDLLVDKALLKIIQLDASSANHIVETSIIRQLPQDLGGLGIVCHTGVVGMKGCLSSRHATHKFLKKLPNNDLRWDRIRAATNETWQPFTIRYDFIPPHLNPEHISEESVLTRIGEREAPVVNPAEEGNRSSRTRSAVPTLDVTIDFEENLSYKDLIKHVQAYHTQRQSDLLSYYQTNDRSCQAAYFLSLQFRGSGSPLNVRGAYQEVFAFTPIEARSVLRLRLLRPPTIADDPISHYTRVCSCGKVIDLDKEFTHGLHCKHILQPLFHACHNDLCHTVARFIKHAHKNCVIGTEVEVVRDAAQGPSVVVTEPGVAHTVHVPDSGEPLKLRVDIKFSEVPGSMPHYLDVTVTDSSAPSYRNYFNSATVAQAAARYREADKARKYGHVIPEIRTHQNFHGFAVEASGRVGPTAEKFLDSLNPDGDDWRKAWMLRTINVLIMKWNARKFMESCQFFKLPLLNHSLV